MENQNNSNEYMVRRTLGLPGEKILLKNGEVYINNKLEQKPIDLQKGLWVKQMSFFDAIHRGDDIDQILLNYKKENWQVNSDGSLISHTNSLAPFSINPEYLKEDKSEIKPIDFAFEFDLTFMKDSGRFQLLAEYYNKHLVLNIPSAIIQKNAHIQEERKIIKSLSKIIFKPGIKHNIRFWLFDHKLAFFLDNKLIYTKAWSNENLENLSETNIVFLANEAAIKIENLIVYRDIGFEPNGRYACEKDTPHQIQEKEIFVCTDNPGSSQTDSRTLGGIKVDKFVKGKAVMTFYPKFLQWIY